MGKTKQTSFQRNDIIRASEIGHYVYCSMGWYLQRCGYEPQSPALESGKQLHIQLGKTLASLEKKRTKSQWLKAASYSLLIIAVLIIIYEVIV